MFKHYSRAYDFRKIPYSGLWKHDFQKKKAIQMHKAQKHVVVNSARSKVVPRRQVERLWRQHDQS